MKQRKLSHSLTSILLCFLLLNALGYIVAKKVSGKPLAFSWEMDRKYLYEVSYHSKAESSVFSDTGLAPSQGIDTHYEVLLEQQLLATQEPALFDLWLRLQPQQAGLGCLIECRVKLNTQGEIQQLFFHPTDKAEARQMVRLILAAMQIHWPQEVSASRWQSMQTDTTGRWPVAYQISKEAFDDIHFVKAYHGGVTADGLNVQRSGELQGVFSEKGHYLISLSGSIHTEFFREKRSMGIDNVTLSVHLKSILHADDDDKALLQKAKTWPASHWRLADLTGEDEYQEVWKNSLYELIKDVTLLDVLEGYRKNDNASGKAMLGLSRQLAAFLQLEPQSSAKDCADTLLSLQPHSAAFSSIAANLSAAGHEPAEAALCDVLEAFREDPYIVRQLTMHLAMVQKPSQKSEDLLKAIAQDHQDAEVVSTAQLGLGAMGKNLRKSHPQRALALFQQAKEDFDASKDKIFHLHVLGNLGHQQQSALIEPLLDSEDAALRSTALYSLRFVESSSAQSLLIQALKSDNNADVRMKALEALHFQMTHSDLLKVYIEQLNHDTSIMIRRELLRNIAPFLKHHQEARDAFTDFMQHCGHPDLCYFAEGLWHTAS